MRSEKALAKVVGEAGELFAANFMATMVLSSRAVASLRLNLQRLVGLSAPLHTWSGIHFGERAHGSLFTVHGTEVGWFHGSEIYGPDGAYLGELKEGRLVIHKAKKSRRMGSFYPQHRTRYRKHANLPERMFFVGFEDFEIPEKFRRSCDVDATSQALVRQAGFTQTCFSGAEAGARGGGRDSGLISSGPK